MTGPHADGPDGAASVVVVTISCGAEPSQRARLCNQAIRTGDSTLLALCEQGAAADPDWWRPAVAAFADPRLAACGTLALCDRLGRITADPEPDEAEDWAYPFARTVPVVLGPCLLIRRAACHAVGGMNEGLESGFAEADLCCRFADHGWRVRGLTAPRIAPDRPTPTDAARLRDRIHFGLIQAEPHHGTADILAACAEFAETLRLEHAALIRDGQAPALGLDRFDAALERAWRDGLGLAAATAARRRNGSGAPCGSR